MDEKITGTDEDGKMYHIRDERPDYLKNDNGTYAVAFDWRDREIDSLKKQLKEANHALVSILEGL